MSIWLTLSLFYRVLRNSVFKLLKHKPVINNFATSYNQFRIIGESVTDHLARERQLAALIDLEIAALPPRMRKIFELSRKQQLSHKEIAAQLNISELTIKDQVKKALVQLRKKIGWKKHKPMIPCLQKLKACNLLEFNQFIEKLKLAKWVHINWFIQLVG